MQEIEMQRCLPDMEGRNGGALSTQPPLSVFGDLDVFHKILGFVEDNMKMPQIMY